MMANCSSGMGASQGRAFAFDLRERLLVTASLASPAALPVFRVSFLPCIVWILSYGVFCGERRYMRSRSARQRMRPNATGTLPSCDVEGSALPRRWCLPTGRTPDPEWR
jgi:hypothetical protein